MEGLGEVEDELASLAAEMRDKFIPWLVANYPELGITSQTGWTKIMLTTRDVARLLGLHINTVRRWSNQGLLKSYRIGPRGDRRFRREEIDSFLNEGEIEQYRHGNQAAKGYERADARAA